MLPYIGYSLIAHGIDWGLGINGQDQNGGDVIVASGGGGCYVSAISSGGDYV